MCQKIAEIGHPIGHICMWWPLLKTFFAPCVSVGNIITRQLIAIAPNWRLRAVMRLEKWVKKKSGGWAYNSVGFQNPTHRWIRFFLPDTSFPMSHPAPQSHNGYHPTSIPRYCTWDTVPGCDGLIVLYTMWLHTQTIIHANDLIHANDYTHKRLYTQTIIHYVIIVGTGCLATS